MYNINMETGLFLALVFVGLLFAWPIRGTMMGHAIGAMLPGAILGLATAMFLGASGNDVYIIAAAGVAGCYYGGKLTYIETCALVYGSNPPEAFARGMIGLAVNGAAWFGFAGGVISIAAKSADYSNPLLLLCLIAALPVAGFIGRRIFNRPHNANTGRFPRIYFSKTKQESWGGMLFMIAVLAAFILIWGEPAGLAPLLGGIVGGAIGFPLAHYLQFLFCYNPACVRFNEKLRLPTWKLMEMTFGAVGGLGVAVGVLFLNKLDIADNILSARWIGFVWLAALACWEIARTISYKYKHPADMIDSWFEKGRITEKEKKKMAPLSESGRTPSVIRFIKNYDYDMMTLLYCYVPMLLIFSGNWQTARIVSCSLILYVMAYRAENRFNPVRSIVYTANGVPAKTNGLNKSHYRILLFLSILAVTALLIGDLTVGCGITLMWIIYTIGCLSYILLYLWHNFMRSVGGGSDADALKKKGELHTMTVFYLVCTIVILLLSI